MPFEQTPRSTPPVTRQAMTPGEYHFECLCRGVLLLHRKYPPVWVARDGPRPKVRWPKRLRLPLRVRAGDGYDRVLIGTPQTAEDLKALNGVAAEIVLARWYRRLGPQHGDDYFAALESRSRHEWEADFKALAQKWEGHWVLPRWLRWPWVLDSPEQAGGPWALRPRPLLLPPGQAPPAEAITCMPLYRDMSEEEWEAGRRAWVRFKRQILPRKRQHGEAFRFRLEVFDLFTELGSVTRVAVRLGKPKSTVSSALRAVLKDIPGITSAALTKLAQFGIDFDTFDPHRHVSGCAGCRRGELCKVIQAWSDCVAPMKGQREIPAGREPTALLKSGR